MDVISERSGLRVRTIHFLIEVGCAEGSLAEAIDESPKCLVLFLSDTEEGGSCGLMWAAANEMGCKHVGEGVKIVNGVWREGSEPFKGRAFEGGGKSFVEDDIMGCIEGDMGYVYFEVFIRVGFSRVTIQREGFPLGRERGVGDGINERVATPRWLGW